MRLSSERITSLQKLLKELCGLDYTSEQAQEAGTAIVRFVTAKAQRQHALTTSKENGYGQPSRGDRVANR
jgi:hypothetical protein